MLRILMCLFMVVQGAVAWGAEEPSKEQLQAQVRAADELARFCQKATEQSNELLAGAPKTTVSRQRRMTYDDAAKALAAEIGASGIPADAELAELNVYQLKHVLRMLQLNNLEMYVALNERLDRMRALGMQPPVDVASEPGLMASVKAMRSVDGVKRSAILQRYLNPPAPTPTPEEAVMGQVKAAAERQEQIENDDLATMSPEEAVAAVLSGRRMRTLPPAPSTLAPLDARTANSFPIESVMPRTLPLSGDVPGTMALRADPPGNPRDAMPSPETVAKLMSATGLSQRMAEEVASGRMGFAEALAAGSAKGPVSQATLLSAADPRWTLYYYGPTQSRNGWSQNDSGFVFQDGGGVYERFDRRLNNDPDTRVNGSIDRRVNMGFDRRMNTQVDPRVNY